MVTDNWRGCYRRGWGKELVPDAFAHPAKVSFSLAERIYEHLAEMGWVTEGDTVIDPFGGIGGFAYHALQRGLNFVGVELEPKFVDLAAQNIALWNGRYTGWFARWGTARIIQGDSRRLSDVVCEAGACVSSPPFGDQVQAKDPKYQAAGDGHGARHSDYGSTPGNLGNLHADGEGFAVAVSSPPFSGAANMNPVIGQGTRAQLRAEGRVSEDRSQSSEGNLAMLRATQDGFTAAVSSPPYANSMNGAGSGIDWTKVKKDYPGRVMHDERIAQNEFRHSNRRYGDTEGQVGSLYDQDFWSAARLIVEQVYSVLKPGGHAVFVCKRFVRGGKIVEFSQQWAMICESIGFHVEHWHRAWLVEDHGVQLSIDGNHQRRRTKRVSFFRRLYEKRRPDLSIDWEDVVCLVK